MPAGKPLPRSAEKPAASGFAFAQDFGGFHSAILAFPRLNVIRFVIPPKQGNTTPVTLTRDTLPKTGEGEFRDLPPIAPARGGWRAAPGGVNGG